MGKRTVCADVHMEELSDLLYVSTIHTRAQHFIASSSIYVERFLFIRSHSGDCSQSSRRQMASPPRFASFAVELH